MYCMPSWVILQTYVTDVKCSGCFCPFHLNAKKKMLQYILMFLFYSQYVVERQFMWVCLCTQTQWVLNQASNMLLKSRFLALIQGILQIF